MSKALLFLSQEDQILREARIWVARVESRDMSDAERADFDAWLAESTEHHTAFEKAHALWRTLGGLEQDFRALESEEATGPLDAETAPFRAPPSVSGETRPSPPFYRRPAACALAGLAAVILVAVFLFAEEMWIAISADAVTAAGQTKEIRLPDGSLATLNTGSAIAIDYAQEERRIRLLRGEAFFDVRPDAARPFRVEASDGVSEAVGTAFAVREAHETVLVTVAHGKVAIRPAADQRKPATDHPLLSANRQVGYGNGGVSTPVREVDAARVLAWRSGTIVFDDVAFSQAIEELDRYFPGRILVANRAGDAPRISGIFQTNEIESAIRAVASVHGLSVAQTPGNLVWVLY